MRQLLCAAAAALLASCAHTRVPAYAGEDRNVQSGVPVKFGAVGEVPEGTEVIWDFGDGTPAAKGVAAEHRFIRSGEFTVTQTIADKDGEKRTATAKVVVRRRSVPMAVPPDARAALVAQQPWARVALQREIADRLGLRSFYDSVARNLSDAVGFDVTNAEASAQNGIDPDEGIGIFTVREDAEALVVAVGVSDEAKAEAAVKKLLERDLTSISPSLRPFQLAEGKLPSGARAVVGTRNGGADQVAYTFKHGYLYLRTPGATDPLLALKGIDALEAEKGLERDHNYLAAIRRVGAGDFVFYSAPPVQGAWGGPGPNPGAAAGGKAPGDAPAAPERMGPMARTMSQLGASAFALRAEKDRIDMRVFAQLRNLTGEKLVQAFSPSKAPPDLAGQLPSGAVAYVKLSGSPAALWRELGRAAGERKDELQQKLRALTGVDVETEWLPHFTGNAGIAFYLDAASVLEAVLGEQVTAFDRSTLVAAVEIADGKADAVKAAIEKGAASLAGKVQVSKSELAGTPVHRFGDGGMVVAQKGNTLFVSFGGPRDSAKDRKDDADEGRAQPSHDEDDEQPAKVGKGNPTAGNGPLAQALSGGRFRTLGDVLKRAGVRGFDLPTDQLLWVDIAGAVRQLKRAAEKQGGAVGFGAGMMADRVAGLRDALFEARPSNDGLDAEIIVRFRKPAGGGKEAQGAAAPKPCLDPPCTRACDQEPCAAVTKSAK